MNINNFPDGLWSDLQKLRRGEVGSFAPGSVLVSMLRDQSTYQGLAIRVGRGSIFSLSDWIGHPIATGDLVDVSGWHVAFFGLSDNGGAKIEFDLLQPNAEPKAFHEPAVGKIIFGQNGARLICQVDRGQPSVREVLVEPNSWEAVEKESGDRTNVLWIAKWRLRLFSGEPTETVINIEN